MPYRGPYRAIASILRRLGVDPNDRFDAHDQDPEYTACRSDELDRYYALYVADSRERLDDDERAVLCCFMLESLNDLIQMGRLHSRQGEILGALIAAGERHAEELAYWMDTSDPDPENWWPITAALLEAKARGFSVE